MSLGTRFWVQKIKGQGHEALAEKNSAGVSFAL